MQFKAYSAERLTIESIASRLTPDENSLRKWLMEYIIDRGIPFNLKSGEMENTGPPEGLTLAKRLAEKRVIVVDAKGNINFVYPVSAIPSHHKVHFDDGRVFSAMCAIDALGAAFTFKRNVVVASRCSECGKPVSVAIKDGQIAQLLPKTAHALHVDLKKIDNWAGSC